MNPLKCLCFTFLFCLVSSLLPADSAKIYEKVITIPTYGVEPADPNPRFYTGRVYQGAQGRIYPYAISDVLTNKKNDETYHVVYLENDYLRICVLPEIGGRIFEAVDKTNNYDFFYKQSVIKPSLIGMLGAWISGGVEWNFPHHHRARTFMPMQHTIKSNDDGSVTLWLSEMDYRHRLRMLIGLTLWPDSNILQAELKFFNPTPFVHSFLYFANPAVHVDSTYQVIFPPEVEFVVQHAKREFAQWPIADTRYGGYNYQNVDISWWKNLPSPVSFFAWQHSSDYFAGYNHGLEAGVAYVADSHLAPGKKFFTFGGGDQGKMWDKMLTDTDGPYLELMAGAYSDNQPDYSWIQPYEVKTIKQSWFPIRNLGGLSYANLNGALNLRVEQDRIFLNLNSTRLQENARLQLVANDKVFYETSLSISPKNPAQLEIPLPANIAESDVNVKLLSNDGRTLLSYKPVQKASNPMPKAVEPPQEPKSYATNEELYLTGLRLNEFYNPQIDPYPYYEEAIARDSNDVRVNTQLGILYAQRGLWQEAEQRLLRAVGRLTLNYTRPKDGEAQYYLGVVQRAMGKEDQAYDAFYRAAWNFAWRAAAFYSLAELDCRWHDYDRALEHVNEAIAMNAYNTKALDLKAVILRKLQKPLEAAAALDKVFEIDVLDPWAKLQEPDYVKSPDMNLDLELCLESATNYADAGFYQEAVDMLTSLSESAHIPPSPMLFYDLGFYYDKLGDQNKALQYLQKAAVLPADYCFPFRLESIDVLNRAIELQPTDALAHYALGNLLYDWQPEKAVEQWNAAVTLNPAFSAALRNLGFGYAQTFGDNEKSIQFYEKAVKLNPQDARLLYELDVLYEDVNAPLKKRQALFSTHAKTALKRDDALARLVEVQVLAGDYDTAIQTLSTHHFNVWEGGGSIHDLFVDAHLMRGLRFLEAKKYPQALADFNSALEYPDNLEVGRPIYDAQTCRTLTLLGQTYAAMGKADDAQRSFEQAAQLRVGDDLLYFQALALKSTGNDERAKKLYQSLVERGESLLQKESEIDFFAKFGEKENQNKRFAHAYYLSGLGALGLGDRAKAKTAFQHAADYDGNNIWVNYYLKTL
jgi:tetratricopeptide (TPR) repeat protein